MIGTAWVVRWLAVPLAVLVGAGAARADDWPAGDAGDIAAVETYLNDLTTYRARFTQQSPDGAEADGMVWLSRPGLARFEYAPPNDLLLVADGDFLIFFDRQIDQVTRFSPDRGPFRFLLAEEVDFGHGVRVTAIERRAGALRISLIDSDDPEEGSVTLAFEENPLRLVRWEVVDAEGKLTRVALFEVEAGLELEGKLFRFTGNDRANPDYRQGLYE
ncbi:MAG: outer membrane lipoprotein carrier protein LolA [Alphaproteobacteria bacterium]|jgi:outer membrane lipoprotein-sorting protein|nr:outer membrane lipoprotein carrier protein LolA [Alphaproteobacteria bacterium]MDP6516063.1 outer membrane lipoprotein carrier protein LolA [Alphaproteobacteria bacterium]